MTSVHDNEVISYEINLKDHYIVINTEDREFNVMIKFTGVLVHLFEDHLYGSILLDIDNYEIDDFIDRNKEILKKHKPNSWPIFYETEFELREMLIKEQYKYYVICSSYGLNGWVLAKKLEINKNDSRRMDCL